MAYHNQAPTKSTCEGNQDTTRFRFTYPAPWYEAPREGILPKPLPRVGYIGCTSKEYAQKCTSTAGAGPRSTSTAGAGPRCTFGQPCQVTPQQMTTHIAQEAREGRVVAPFPVHDQLSFPSDWEEGWLDVPTTWSGW